MKRVLLMFSLVLLISCNAAKPFSQTDVIKTIEPEVETINFGDTQGFEGIRFEYVGSIDDKSLYGNDFGENKVNYVFNLIAPKGVVLNQYMHNNEEKMIKVLDDKNKPVYFYLSQSPDEDLIAYVKGKGLIPNHTFSICVPVKGDKITVKKIQGKLQFLRVYGCHKLTLDKLGDKLGIEYKVGEYSLIIRNITDTYIDFVTVDNVLKEKLIGPRENQINILRSNPVLNQRRSNRMEIDVDFYCDDKIKIENASGEGDTNFFSGGMSLKVGTNLSEKGYLEATFPTKVETMLVPFSITFE